MPLYTIELDLGQYMPTQFIRDGHWNGLELHVYVGPRSSAFSCRVTLGEITMGDWQDGDVNFVIFKECNNLIATSSMPLDHSLRQRLREEMDKFEGGSTPPPPTHRGEFLSRWGNRD